jgi:O-succinylhomoserine sulfhydrylase
MNASTSGKSVVLPPDAGPATRAVRAGQARGLEGEHNDPIYVTSSFVFDSAAQAAARFAETEPGNVYSRFTNPTVRAFEERLAAMEGAAHAVATASGMGGILSTCLALLKAGDHVVAADSLFGSTVSLFTNVLSRFGIETSFVPVTDPAAWQRALRPQTRLMFVESPTNPLGDLADIPALARIAHAHGVLLVVDNCFLTPVLQCPLVLGADIVVHSATKYLDGQGRCVGGAIVTNDRKVRDAVFGFLRTGGPSMSPFNAWVFLNGLETLPLRMRAHGASALHVATWLEAQEGVIRVLYPGLASHPQHALACRQQSGFGGIVSFEIEGAREQAFAFIDACRWISITANFGDAKTTITHPASTTHGRLTPEQRERAGIGEGLLRVSVGLEDAGDIVEELALGLAAARDARAGSSGRAASG